MSAGKSPWENSDGVAASSSRSRTRPWNACPRTARFVGRLDVRGGLRGGGRGFRGGCVRHRNLHLEELPLRGHVEHVHRTLRSSLSEFDGDTPSPRVGCASCQGTIRLSCGSSMPGLCEHSDRREQQDGEEEDRDSFDCAHCASRIGLARNARRGMHSERHDSGAPPRFWHRAKRRHQMPSQAAKITSAKGAANVTEFSTKRRTRSPPPRNSPRL